MDFIIYILLGGIISVLSGFFGVGGGFILTPILLLLGFPVLEAITTSLLFTIGTSSSGIFAHLRLKNIIWKAGLILGVSGVTATQIAKPAVLFLDKQGLSELVIPFLYIVLLAYFTMKMIGQGKKASNLQEQEPVFSILGLVLIGFFSGLISSTLGVGGGFIIVPLLISYLNFNPKKAVGTSLFAVLMIVAAGFASYVSTIAIDYVIGLLLIIGGLIGSQFGARLTVFYRNKEMNLLLGALYFVTLISVVLRIFEYNTAGLTIMSMFILVFFVRSLTRIRVTASA